MDHEFNEMRVNAYDAWGRAAELGLTAQDIRNMDWDEYSRLVGRPDRPTPARAALSAYFSQDEPEKPSNPAAARRSSAPAGNLTPSNSGTPVAVSGPPMGRPFEELAAEGGEEGFHAWRAQRRSSGEGVGIMDSVSSTSQAYRDAAAQHAGRTGYVQGTNDAAELLARRGRAIVKKDELPQYRNPADRFRFPGSAYQG